MHYICTKFRENISKDLRVIEQTQFPYNNFQWGMIPSKMQVELRYLFSAHCLIVLCICTKFCENISKAFRVTEGHDFPTKIFKGSYIILSNM